MHIVPEIKQSVHEMNEFLYFDTFQPELGQVFVSLHLNSLPAPQIIFPKYFLSIDSFDVTWNKQNLQEHPHL